MKPQTNHNKAAGTREVPQDVLSDIEDIVNYLIVDELEHCRARRDALDAAPILPPLTNVQGCPDNPSSSQLQHPERKTWQDSKAAK